MNATQKVELSKQEATILNFLRSMGAFADRNNNKSGEGVSLHDINYLYIDYRGVLENLSQKNCIFKDTVTCYDESSAPIKFDCYYIKPTGAFSLYMYENSQFDREES